MGDRIQLILIQINRAHFEKEINLCMRVFWPQHVAYQLYAL